jgi:hypothetical protein
VASPAPRFPRPGRRSHLTRIDCPLHVRAAVPLPGTRYGVRPPASRPPAAIDPRAWSCRREESVAAPRACGVGRPRRHSSPHPTAHGHGLLRPFRTYAAPPARAGLRRAVGPSAAPPPLSMREPRPPKDTVGGSGSPSESDRPCPRALVPADADTWRPFPGRLAATRCRLA